MARKEEKLTAASAHSNEWAVSALCRVEVVMEKLSELIAKLQAVLDEHGDMPVASYDYYEEPCWGWGSFDVKVSEAHYPFAAHDETQGGKYVELPAGLKYLELP